MFAQTFDWIDLPRLFFLAFIEILLSADNAIVLGIFTHQLPERLKKKALYIGALSAFFFRLFAVLSIGWLIQYSWIQLLGGVYLIYLSIHHFVAPKKALIPPLYASFWKTILMIELFDLAFAIDSIMAAFAFISSNSMHIESKLWMVYLGGMFGLFGIRYAAHLFSSWIHRFSRLEKSAYLMIGWIGCKLTLEGFVELPSLFPFIFWPVLAALFLYGISKKISRKRK